MKHQASLESILHSYGDLLYDLCASVTEEPKRAQDLYRSVFQKISSDQKHPKYIRYERPWLLKLTCEILLKEMGHQSPKGSTQEQIFLNDQADISTKFQHFPSYFKRLSSHDQLLLLLKDKHGVALSDISSALDIPVGALKVKRQQALRALENGSGIQEEPEDEMFPVENFSF